MISIIMSIKNSSKIELENSIKSILNQTYSDFEFIICNDSSEDDTLKRLNIFCKSDERIKIINNETSNGLAYALNLCLDECQGEYIARMDVDDISYPNRLEKQIEFLNDNPNIDFCSSNIDLFDGKNITLKNRKYKEFPSKKDLIKSNPFVHPATFFRKHMIKTLGGYNISKETRRAEDYDLFFRAYEAGYRGANIQEPLLRYKLTKSDIKKKWTFQSRIELIQVKKKGARLLGIKGVLYLYVYKPLILLLIPSSIMYNLQLKKKR